VPPEQVQRSSVAARIIAAVLVAAALALGRDFFIPIALALSFFMLFSPVVRRLQRAGLAPPLGGAVVVLGGLALFGIGVWALSGPMGVWAEKAPASIATARQKLSAIGGPLSKLSNAASGAQAAPAQAPPPRPAAEAPSAPPPFLTQLLGGAASVVGLVVQVVVLLYLMLSMGEMLFAMLLDAIPGAHKRTASEILDQTESVVSRYLVTTALINAGQGVAIGVAMWAIGMPNPLIWGLLTFALEFIPMLGGFINVALLLLGGLTVFTSAGRILLPAIIYLVISTIQNNVVSPYAYGNSLKLNPLAVLICVLFWWFIWGVPGAFLAIPIAAMLKVVGDQVPRLAPMGKLLGEASAAR
jgi:predicted PurR-regulated permease PerM